jgi:hypothetical protein
MSESYRKYHRPALSTPVDVTPGLVEENRRERAVTFADLVSHHLPQGI